MTPSRKLLFPLIIVAASTLALSVARTVAQEEKPADTPPAWITEIDRDADSGQLHLLLNVGRDAGLERGDSLEVVRDGKKLARATIVASFPDFATASVDAVEKDQTVTKGDWVKVTGKGKRAPPTPMKPITVREVSDKAVKVDGLEPAEAGSTVRGIVTREGKPIGRLSLKCGAGGWTATLEDGEAKPGDRIELVEEHGRGKGDNELTPDEIKRLRREADPPKGVDFAATGFLGVVGEIEHPTRVMAPCHIGVLVRRIAEGSPAERAKIRVGDRVIAIDDRIVRTPGEIYHGIRRRATDQVRVTIAREDVLQVVTADFTKK